MIDRFWNSRCASAAVLMVRWHCCWSALVGDQLPMDAIPTSPECKVQVNTTVPALAPDEVEKL